MNRKYLNSQTGLVVFGILLFHLSTLRGQQIDWSAPYEMRSIFNENKLIQYSPKGFYWMHKYKDEQYYFRRKVAYYTPILEQKKSGENLNLYYDKLKGTYQFSLSIDDTPHLCYSINDKENKKESIFVDPLNQNTLAVHKAPILLFELAYKDKIHDLEGYRYCYSQDASKCLIYGKMPYKRQEKGQLALFVGNKKLERLAFGVAKVQQKAKQLALSDLVDAVVDNQGNAYLLCKLYKSKDKKEEKKKGTRFVYTLIRMDHTATVQVLDTLKVLAPMDSAIVVSAKLSVNNKTGAISCLGTYKIADKENGLFKFDLGQNEWKAAKIIQYPNAILEKAKKSPPKIQKKKELGFQNYKIKTVWEQADGTQLVFAEQHYIKVYWDKLEGRQELHQINDILVAKLAENDTILWARIIPKRQKGGGDGYTNVPDQFYSFGAFKKKEVIHILYNDLEENLTIDKDKERKVLHCNQPQNCSLIDCQLDARSGEVIGQQSLLQLKKDKIVVYPKKIRLLKDDKVLIMGIKPQYGAKGRSYFHFGCWEIEEKKDNKDNN